MRTWLLIISIVSVMLALPVMGDRVELASGVHDNVTIQAIRGGQLYFQDARSGFVSAEVAAIRTIAFTGLPEFDLGERAFLRGDMNDALAPFLRAYFTTTSEPARLWMHARLARIHRERGELVEAAGHLAQLWLIDPAPAWVALAPETGAEFPSAGFASIVEARRALERLVRRELDPAVKGVVDRLVERVESLYAAASSANAGPEPREGSTLSGYARTEIARPDWRPADPSSAAPGGATDPSRSSEAGSAPLPTPAPVPVPAPGRAENNADGAESAGAIEALLEVGSFREALDRCERAARAPGNRDLARFLHQYGRALTGAGKPRDAAVRFMQCAVLYDDSVYAPASLLETARIHRDTFNQPETADRLLERAASLARARGLNELAEQAERLRRMP